MINVYTEYKEEEEEETDKSGNSNNQTEIPDQKKIIIQNYMWR